MDFTDSGQSKVNVHQLMADGVLLSNAIECVNWVEDPIQLFVCESCGIPGCESGGWMRARSTGNDVLLIPDFQSMLGNQRNSFHYRPPYFREHRNQAVFLPHGPYERLRVIVGKLPVSTTLPKLTYTELAWLAQWEAPLQALGSLPEAPRLKRDKFVTASWESPEQIVDIVGALLTHAFASNAPVVLVPTRTDDVVVSCFLDDVDFEELRPIALSDGEWFIHLEPGYLAKAVQANHRAS